MNTLSSRNQDLVKFLKSQESRLSDTNTSDILSEKLGKIIDNNALVNLLLVSITH